jgi:hypothetical protein
LPFWDVGLRSYLDPFLGFGFSYSEDYSEDVYFFLTAAFVCLTSFFYLVATPFLGAIIESDYY